jgi:hypothetical protein
MDYRSSESRTWPDVAIGLYDKLTGRNAEIAYEFHDLEVFVPASTAPDAERARWKVNGIVKIRTRDFARS